MASAARASARDGGPWGAQPRRTAPPRCVVAGFAGDEEAFHAAFTAAFQKLQENGHANLVAV